MPKIISCFKIANRGTVAVIDEPTNVMPGVRVSASIMYLDGSSNEFKAWKESLISRDSGAAQSESFLILNADIEAVPIGATITFS